MNHSEGSAVVIGAAGDIGRAVATTLCRRGMSVLGVDLKPAAPHLVAVESYKHVQFDFSTPDAVAALLDSGFGINARYIVNVAGGALSREIAASELTFAWDALDGTMNANLCTSLAAIAFIVEIAKACTTSADTSITLCSSINAIGNYQYPLYSASKGAVEALVSSLCVPLGKRGVRINCVRLGTVLTEASKALHGESNDEHYGSLRRGSALDRFVSIDEAASALISTAVELSGVTGSVLTVDAGQSVPRTA